MINQFKNGYVNELLPSSKQCVCHLSPNNTCDIPLSTFKNSPNQSVLQHVELLNLYHIILEQGI
jgi:hypothetical protein